MGFWAGLTLEGKVADLEALMRAPRGGDDWSVADEGVVDAGVGHKVGLELVQIDIERAIESERRRDGADDLRDQPVEVLVGRPGDVKVATADVVDGLVIHQEGAVRVLDSAVGREDGVVGLDDGVGNAGRGVHTELELRLLSVLVRKTLEEERAEAGTGTTAERVEDEEALETNAVVGDAADLVEDLVDELLANCVVTPRVVVGGVLLAGDHLLGVEQVAVGTGPDLVDDVGLEIAVDGTGDVLALA